MRNEIITPIVRKKRYSPTGTLFNYSIKRCIECNKEYKPNTNVAKYCSLTCQNRNRRRRNKKTISNYNKMYAKKYPLRTREWSKKSRSTLSSKKKKSQWVKNKKKNDINFRIAVLMRRRIYMAVKDIISTGERNELKKEISYNEIAKHLINILPKDLNERDYHIDHIEPLCSFDLTDKEQFKQAFSPENHQWLTKEENFMKIKEDKLKSIRCQLI